MYFFFDSAEETIKTTTVYDSPWGMYFLFDWKKIGDWLFFYLILDQIFVVFHSYLERKILLFADNYHETFIYCTYVVV